MYGYAALPHLDAVPDLAWATVASNATVSTIAAAATANWNTLLDAERRLNPARYLINPPRVATEPNVRRRYQAVKLSQLLPGLDTKPIVWTNSADKIIKQPKVAPVWRRLCSLRRDGGLVIIVDVPLDRSVAGLLMWLWQAFCLPLPGPKVTVSTNLRWCVPTSNIPGASVKAKLSHLKTLPKALRIMICLVADDLNVPTVLKLAARLDCRVSYDVLKVRDSSGARITRGSALYQCVAATWGDACNPSRAPLLFASAGKGDAKLVRHFCAPREITVEATQYRKTQTGVKRRTKPVKVMSTVGAAHLILV